MDAHEARSVDAERALRAALDVAREQHARSWELRAGTTLARLLEQRGDVAAARALLTPIHGWFTEGFDTRDLQDATRLLERLAE
jgi:predicted ATPase